MAAKNIGMAILAVLEKLYGKSFINQFIGTRSNVVKPKQLDPNAPTKNTYSPDAFKDEKLIETIDEKIMEYAPFMFGSKNTREQMNFLENAEQLLAARNKQTGNIKKEGIEVKDTADVIDINTGKKVDEQGIMSLQEDLGLDPEINPKSPMGKNLRELKRLDKEADLAKKDIEETMDTGLESIFKNLMRGPSKDVMMEGKRRAVIRKILLRDDRIDLPEDVRKSLSNYDDLRGGGTAEMDPLNIFDTYYKRDENKFNKLDDIIDVSENEFKASDEFLKEDQFDLIEDVKPPRDEKASGGLSYLMGL